jgi:uncharacterized protein (TIGR02996 family)
VVEASPRARRFVEVRRLTLLDLLRASGPLPAEAAVAFGVALCDQALLEKGPRRLRGAGPRTVFFTRDGHVAASSEGGPPYDAMPPEEVRGLTQDERSDVHTATLLVYSALCGDRPLVAGNSDIETLQLALAVSLRPLPAPAPAGLAAVFARGLHVEPARRYESLEALRTALSELPSDAALLRRRVASAWEDIQPTPPPAPAPTVDTTEGRLLERLRAGEDAARLVYADLLETQGRLAEAEWLRREREMRTLTGDAQLQALAALRKVNVSLEFMASVARPELEACGVTFGFRCPRTWDALALTDDPLVRWCGACEERVHFAAALDEAEALAALGHCVAVSDAVARTGEPLGEALRSGYLGRAPAPRVRRQR